jgi:hypothetical protein
MRWFHIPQCIFLFFNFFDSAYQVQQKLTSDAKTLIDLEAIFTKLSVRDPLLLIKPINTLIYLLFSSGSLIKPFQPTVVRGFSKYTRIMMQRSSLAVSLYSIKSLAMWWCLVRHRRMALTEIPFYYLPYSFAAFTS